MSRSTIVCFHTIRPSPAHTCHHSYHSNYGETNFPLLLFDIEKNYDNPLGTIYDLYENDGKVLDWEGFPIRDFPFLPRYIAARPEAWLFEYWARTDSRVSYKDIKTRMTVDPRERPGDNLLNMRREREIRGPLGLSLLESAARVSTVSYTVTRVEVERLERWNIGNITYNAATEVGYDMYGRSQFLREKEFLPGSTIFTSTNGQPTYPLNTFLH